MLQKQNAEIVKTALILFAALVLIYGNVSYAKSGNFTGRDVAVLVHERPDGDDRKVDMTITLINKRGKKRVRSVVSMKKEYGKDSKSIMYFRKPSDVKGTGFLQFDYDDSGNEDDRWLYLPALKKVRRIAGSSKNDYFMGTDFTYDDLGDRNVDDDIHTLLREEEIEGHSCWVKKAEARDNDYIYSKVITWVRKDIHMPVRAEFYDRHSKLLKKLTYSDIKMVDGFWTPHKLLMENVQHNHQTLIEYTNVHHNLGLKDNLFRVSTIARGKIK